MFFEIIGPIANIETIARGAGIRSLSQIKKKHGAGAWRKMKGTARVRLAEGTEGLAEIHWYEAHGIGKKDFKIKRFFG